MDGLKREERFIVSFSLSPLTRGLGPLQRVLQKHRDGHGPHPARNRGDLAGHLDRRVEVHVPDEPVTPLLGGVVHGVDSHVDHRAAGLQPLALDELRDPAGRNNDVRLPDVPLGVLRPGVDHRDGGVPLLQEHGGGRADNVAPANHHGGLSGYFHPGALQKLHAPLRGAAHEVRLPAAHGKLANVLRVEPVHVLLDGDRGKDLLLVHVRGERQLNENTVDLGVRVVLLDHLEDFLLRRCVGEVRAEAHNSAVVARLFLVPHVRLGVLALSDQHDGEAGVELAAGLTPQPVDLILDLAADRSRDGLAVDQLCAVPLGGHGWCWRRLAYHTLPLLA
mmetsp:Transcript_5513/g.19904  ORF Transcript_5513/g.19904 Transcript_5513/m.19904 type:complete len:334 (-) Transcript_5513:387-1388(-)